MPSAAWGGVLGLTGTSLRGLVQPGPPAKRQQPTIVIAAREKPARMAPRRPPHVMRVIPCDRMTDRKVDEREELRPRGSPRRGNSSV
jgi:hypothetical protein